MQFKHEFEYLLEFLKTSKQPLYTTSLQEAKNNAVLYTDLMFLNWHNNQLKRHWSAGFLYTQGAGMIKLQYKDNAEQDGI